MSNLEIFKEIKKEFKYEVLTNPVYGLLQMCENNPQQNASFKILYEGLNYFYYHGYLHFQKMQWGITEINEVPKKDRDATLPFGMLLLSIYKMCKELHAVQDINIPVKYSNAFRWFTACFLELMAHDLYDMFSSETKDIIQIWQNRVSSLKIPDTSDRPLEIPYNPFRNSKINTLSMGLLLLIESAYARTSESPTFRNDYWKPFIIAQQDIINKFKTDNHLTKIRFNPTSDTGTIEYQTLQNRGRPKAKKSVTLYP